MLTEFPSFEPLFFRVFHESPVGMAITTVAEGRYVDVNNAYARILGYRREELIGQSFPVLGLENSEERDLVLGVLKRLRRLGDIRLTLQTRSGVSRTCICSIQLEEIQDQAYFINIVRDISEEEQARQSLESSEKRFRLFFQSIPLPLLVTDEETGYILDVNDAACQTYGYTPEEFAGLTLPDLLPPGDRAEWSTASSISGERIICRQQLKNGSVIEAEVTSYSFPLDQRLVNLLIVRNVTERRAIENALKASQERLSIIADVATDAIWDFDLEKGEVLWSPGLSHLFGYGDHRQSLPDWWLSRVHPDDAGAIAASIDQALNSQELYWSGEYRFLRADGSYANVLDRATIVRDESGRPTRMMGAMVDITEQLHVAEAVTRAALDERQRLARDLHDSVTQSLYSISLMAEAARRHASLGDKQVTTEFIGRMGELSQQALRQLRLLVYELRPAMLEQEGLAGALRHRLDAVEGRAGIKTRLVENVSVSIPAELQAELFWIAQEALNSSLKHSLATDVTVRLISLSGKSFVLEIEDNGPGFELSGIESGEGLASIRRRVEVLGGSVEIDSSANSTTMRARVPINCSFSGR